jgi:hypothetical protein
MSLEEIFLNLTEGVTLEELTEGVPDATASEEPTAEERDEEEQNA